MARQGQENWRALLGRPRSQTPAGLWTSSSRRRTSRLLKKKQQKQEEQTTAQTTKARRTNNKTTRTNNKTALPILAQAFHLFPFWLKSSGRLLLTAQSCLEKLPKKIRKTRYGWSRQPIGLMNGGLVVGGWWLVAGWRFAEWWRGLVVWSHCPHGVDGEQ